MKDYGSNLDVDRLRGTARERTGAVGAIIVGLVAAVVVVGPHFLRSSPTTNEATDPANGVESSTAAGPFVDDRVARPCRRRPGGLDPVLAGDARLRPGAVEVTLCRPTSAGHPSSRTVAAGRLVLDVDRFVELVNSAPEAPDESCPTTPAAGARFALAFRYPSGRTLWLAGRASACATVRVHRHDVSSGALLAAFRHALLAQRAVSQRAVSQRETAAASGGRR